MNFIKQSALIGTLLGAAVLLSAPASASPLGASAREGLSASTAASSLLIEVQRRRGGGGPGPRRGGGGGNNAGAAVAAGIIGLAIGGMIAAESQRQQNAEYCASRYRSYDPNSGTYVARNGQRYPCP